MKNLFKNAIALLAAYALSVAPVLAANTTASSLSNVGATNAITDQIMTVRNATDPAVLTNGVSFGGNIFNPAKFPGPYKLDTWVDPSDQSTQTIQLGAYLNAPAYLAGGAAGGYLKSANVASSSKLDFSSGQKFEVIGFRNNHCPVIANANCLNQTFVANFNITSGGSWMIASGGSAGQANGIELFMRTNATTGLTANTWNVSGAGQNIGVGSFDWSMYDIAYDGTQSTPANRATALLDNINMGAGNGGTSLPANPQPPNNIPLTIGTDGSVLSSFTQQVSEHGIAIWNRNLTTGERTSVWNNGVGISCAQMTGSLATGLVACYNLTEAAGATRVDSTASPLNLTETGGTVPQSQSIMSIIDKSPTHYNLKPFAAYVTSASIPTYVSYGAAPLLEANSLNGVARMHFYPYENLYTAATNPWLNDNIAFFQLPQMQAFDSSSESLELSSASQSSDLVYVIPEYVVNAPLTSCTGTFYPGVRLRNNETASFTGSWCANNATMSTGVPYVQAWLNVVDPVSLLPTVYFNQQGINGTPVVSNIAQNGPAESHPRANITYNTLCRQNACQQGTNWEHYEGDFVAAENVSIDQWWQIQLALAAKYHMIAPQNGITPNASGTLKTVTTGSTYTVLKTDGTVCINKGTGSATTVTLPVVGAGDIGLVENIVDCKGDAATNNITVNPDAGHTIDGSSSFVESTNYQFKGFFWNGAIWKTK